MRTVIFIWMFAICLCGLAVSQSTETVLYSFGAYPTDGEYPEGELIFSSNGNIYGITGQGVAYCLDVGGCGTLYKLSPSASGQWTERVLYNFCSTGNPSTCPDGSNPNGGLDHGRGGNLCTEQRRVAELRALGTVFRLSPPSISRGSLDPRPCSGISPSNSPATAVEPGAGALSMDPSGNIYGTTVLRRVQGNLGVVFELSPQLATERTPFSLVHSFSGVDGALPEYGVTLDGAGNLYGATSNGGRGKSLCNHGCGLVYELSPVNGTWQETVVYEFDGIVGANPVSPISIDKFGNLYGTFEVGGGGDCFLGTCGGIFKLVPQGEARKVCLLFQRRIG